jgi:hypothetical protein
VADRMIPVRESLIERTVQALAFEGIDVPELSALLSQPTPTAEPDEGGYCHCGTAKESHSIEEHAYVDMGIPPVEYQSIVQLNEGSTFYARQHGDPQERFWFLAAGMGVVSLDAIMAHANSIDPSTIRDVTPPKEQS